MQGEAQHLFSPLGDERRRSGRIPCEDLRSNLGPVLDLSSEGARLLVRRFRSPPSNATMVVQISGYGCSVSVEAETVRVRRISFGQFDVGLRFHNLTPEQRRAICDIVRTHSVRYAIVRDKH